MLSRRFFDECSRTAERKHKKNDFFFTETKKNSDTEPTIEDILDDDDEPTKSRDVRKRRTRKD